MNHDGLRAVLECLAVALEYIARAATDAGELGLANVAVSGIESMMPTSGMSGYDRREVDQIRAILKTAKEKLEERRKKAVSRGGF